MPEGQRFDWERWAPVLKMLAYAGGGSILGLLLQRLLTGRGGTMGAIGGAGAGLLAQYLRDPYAFTRAQQSYEGTLPTREQVASAEKANLAQLSDKTGLSTPAVSRGLEAFENKYGRQAEPPDVPEAANLATATHPKTTMGLSALAPLARVLAPKGWARQLGVPTAAQVAVASSPAGENSVETQADYRNQGKLGSYLAANTASEAAKAMGQAAFIDGRVAVPGAVAGTTAPMPWRQYWKPRSGGGGTAMYLASKPLFGLLGGGLEGGVEGVKSIYTEPRDQLKTIGSTARAGWDVATAKAPKFQAEGGRLQELLRDPRPMPEPLANYLNYVQNIQRDKKIDTAKYAQLRTAAMGTPYGAETVPGVHNDALKYMKNAQDITPPKPAQA